MELWSLEQLEKKLSGMQIAGENLIENLPDRGNTILNILSTHKLHGE